MSALILDLILDFLASRTVRNVLLFWSQTVYGILFTSLLRPEDITSNSEQQGKGSPGSR